MTAAGPPLTLTDGIAEVVVRPDLGGGLAAYDLLVSGTRRRLFRRAPAATADPFALACNPLLPWSNRISSGGFRFAGRLHPLAANWPGEVCPLHGNGFLSPWQLAYHAADAATLRLHSDGPGPFRYSAELCYRLDQGALAMRLTVRHRGAGRLPYGLGFHPWLVRSAATTLRAPAQAVWLEDARHLPERCVPVAQRPEWDFTAPRRLPDGWINNGFVGWDGGAEIAWPDRGLALAIDTRAEAAVASALSAYIVYSPGSEADFFCFEPVSHPVDAHNLAGQPGLFVLAPGDSATVQARFIPAARHRDVTIR